MSVTNASAKVTIFPETAKCFKKYFHKKTQCAMQDSLQARLTR